MKIWGRINSSNVRKVLWCAEELSLSYESIPAGGAFGIVNEPEYLVKNPNGRIPCLEDGGLILWESNVIVRYLAQKYGQAPFAPKDLQLWYAAEKWMDWTSLSFGMPFRNLFWNLVRYTPEQRNEDEIAFGIEHCTGLMEMANTALSKAPYLSGDNLGIGDIPLGSIAYSWFSFPIERPSMPALEDWYERLKARPAYQKGVMTPLT
jgi:glutathione S-transferase